MTNLILNRITYMKFLKSTAPLVLGLLLVAGSVFAQGQQMQQPAQPDSITDEELEKFSDISTEAQKIQQQTQQKVDSMLADKEMDMQRFQEIMMSQQNQQNPQAQGSDSVEITEQEQETIDEIQPKLMQIQQQSQQEFVSIIQDNGLNPQRFQQIMQAVRSNPEVMKRFQEIAGQPQNGQQPPQN